MKPKKVTLEGVEFRLNPLKPRKVLRITKNIIQLIGEGSRGGTKTQIMAAISDGLQSMTDDDFDEFCLLVLSSTQAVTKEEVVEILTMDDFDAAFFGLGIENVFVLIYEVLVYNRFPLVRDLDLNIGELIQGMMLSVKEEMQENDNKLSTESQENSTES